VLTPGLQKAPTREDSYPAEGFLYERWIVVPKFLPKEHLRRP